MTARMLVIMLEAASTLCLGRLTTRKLFAAFVS